MKLSTKSIEECCIGHFVNFGISANDQVNVKYVCEATYRWRIFIDFPEGYVGNKLAVVYAVLQRFNTGGMVSIRMDYSNLISGFSLEELEILELCFKFYTFHIYGTPKSVIPQQQSNLDIQRIVNSVRRQEDRERRQRLSRESVKTMTN